MNEVATKVEVRAWESQNKKRDILCVLYSCLSNHDSLVLVIGPGWDVLFIFDCLFIYIVVGNIVEITKDALSV